MINKRLDAFLDGETSVKETMQILEDMVLNPDMQEYVISAQRLRHASELRKDFGMFLPINSMAADDGRNLCDFQCETYLLRKYGKEVQESKLAVQARNNYWLSSRGTPLYNIGKMLEANGLLVNRIYDAKLVSLVDYIKDHDAIVVVNGEKLKSPEKEDLFEENEPNHAVIVLSVDKDEVVLYNPATNNEQDTYPIEAFLAAWSDSHHYLVLVRERKYAHEYHPLPIDLNDISLSPELLQLTDTIAENAHDVWAVRKKRENPQLEYAPLNENGEEQPGYNHYFRPYSELSDKDKQPDIDMALTTIKLLKRLGYRLVNMNTLYRCSGCDSPIEMQNLYCPHCGRKLSWEDFK